MFIVSARLLAAGLNPHAEDSRDVQAQKTHACNLTSSVVYLRPSLRGRDLCNIYPGHSSSHRPEGRALPVKLHAPVHRRYSITLLPGPGAGQSIDVEYQRPQILEYTVKTTRKLALASAALLPLSLIAIVEAMPANAATTGIHVSGQAVLDGNGKTFMMRGTNEPHAWYPSYTASDLGWQKGWGANTVRVVLSGGRWTANSASDVASVVSSCKSNKLICILEDHDTTGYGEASGAYSLSAAADYWISIKSAFVGQENYILINIGNEPYGNSNTANWTADTKSAISKLRNAGITNALVVDAPNWGQDNNGVMKSNAASVESADSQHNTIFSVHMYSQYSSASTITSYVNYLPMNGQACGSLASLAAGSGRVWAVDCAPARDTALGDVAGRIVVGVGNDPARPTVEGFLVGPVAFVPVPALGAGLGGVPRVDGDQRYPGPARLVGEERAELVERPGLQGDPLGLAEPDPVADARQVFDGDSATGACSLGHDCLGDDVVDVRGVPRFFPAPPGQQPLRGLGALGLQALRAGAAGDAGSR